MTNDSSEAWGTRSRGGRTAEWFPTKLARDWSAVFERDPLPGDKLMQAFPLPRNRSGQATARCVRPTLELLEMRDVPSGSPFPITGLSAGESAGLLNGLVGKWFYSAGVRYEQAQGALFGPHGPQATDVAQGKTADCFFLSSQAGSAPQSPQLIDHMFSQNSDGTYTVRFYQ
jgi:hypothetical protein